MRRHATEQLAIDEVGDAAREQAQRRAANDGVADAHPGDLVPPRVPQQVQRHAQNAAVTGHAAIRDAKEEQRVVNELVEVVEQHVPQPPAQHDTEQGRAGDQVRHGLRLDLGQSAFRQAVHNQVAQVKAQHVSQSVPVNADSVSEANEIRREVVDVDGEHAG